MASSTDVVGPLTTTAQDAVIVSDILAGQDGHDGTVHPDYFEPQTTTARKKSVVGIIDDFVSDGVDEDVKKNTLELADKLGQAGYEIKHVSRNDGFMPENKRRIMIGSYVLSSGFYDAYYLKAQKARTLLINEFNKLFEDCDYLLCPTAPTPAFKLGENTDDPLKMYLADAMTVPPSLAGLPAISVPNGTDKNGLPIGAQLIGQMKDDAGLLNFAESVEDIVNA